METDYDMDFWKKTLRMSAFPRFRFGSKIVEILHMLCSLDILPKNAFNHLFRAN